jgi:hypothetical protein
MTFDVRIVVHHDHAIASCVDIQLDPVSPKLQRSKERRYRVFGECVVCAAMRDALGHVALSWRGQASLGVVAFSAMSAKL